MNLSQKTFISALRSFVTGDEFLPDKNVDWDEMIDFATRQNLLGMLCYVLDQSVDKSNHPADKEMAILKNIYFRTIVRSVNQQIASDELCAALSAAGLLHVLFKGMTIKKYYPVPELRTMGDMDILVKKKDKAAAEKVLTNLGYAYNNANVPGGAVSKYIKGNIDIELHTDLMYFRSENGLESAPVPLDWDKFKPMNDGGCTLVPTAEYSVFLQTAHTARHFLQSGCGFRYLLDFAFTLPHYENWCSPEITKLLDAHNLLKFYETIVSYCAYNLGAQVHNPPDRLDEVMTAALDDEFSSRTVHGNRNQKLVDEVAKVKQTHKNKTMVKLRLIFSHLFLQRKTLAQKYTFLNKYPWLIFAAHIMRIFRLIFNRKARSNAAGKLDFANNIDVIANARIDLIKNIFG